MSPAHIEGSAVRLTWLDSAKGVGITLVVVGHIVPATHDAIFRFHMPLFFLIAGMTFRSETWHSFWRKRAKSYLVPYIAFLVLVLALDLALAHACGRGWDLPIATKPLRAGLQLIAGGDALKGVYGTFWFLPCLAAALALANLAIRFGTKGIVGGIAASVVYSALMPSVLSPWALLVAPDALGFVLVGRLVRDNALIDRIPVYALPLVACAALAAGWYAAPMDMKQMDFGTPFLTPLCAVLASIALLRFAKLVDNPVLVLLGQASLAIMFLHLTVFHDLAHWLTPWAIVPFAIVVPWGTFLAMQRFSWSNIIFLGGRAMPRAMDKTSARPDGSTQVSCAPAINLQSNSNDSYVLASVPPLAGNGLEDDRIEPAADDG